MYFYSQNQEKNFTDIITEDHTTFKYVAIVKCQCR